MKTSSKAFLGAGALLLATLSPLPALAHTDIGVSIGLGVPVYAAPAPVYYAPPPPPSYYYAPRVVYTQPYYAPAPYYAPRVYYRETYYRSGPRYDRRWDDDDRGYRHHH